MAKVWIQNSATKGFAEVDEEIVADDDLFKELYGDKGWTASSAPPAEVEEQHDNTAQEEANAAAIAPQAEEDPEAAARETAQSVANEEILAKADPDLNDLNIFHIPTGWSAKCREEEFSDVWEPNGWVRAPLDSEGNPTHPADYVPADTATADTADAEPLAKASKKG